MRIKLVDTEQFQLLREGDILEKFPVKGIPETLFDNSLRTEIYKYVIRTINHKKQSLSLVQANKPHEMFTWPSDEDRFYTTYLNLVSENIWWISTCLEKEAKSVQVTKIYEH